MLAVESLERNAERGRIPGAAADLIRLRWIKSRAMERAIYVRPATISSSFSM
jgi:hypothetical protein